MARRKARRKKRRYSARGSSPRRGRSRRRGRRRGSIKLSLISKSALAVAGLVPVVIAGGSALNRLLTPAFAVGTSDATIMSKVTLAAAQFANELSQGFTGRAAFNTLSVMRDDGTMGSVPLLPVTPSGAYLITTAVATGVVVADAVRSWILNVATRRGGRAARWFGQTLTTGR